MEVNIRRKEKMKKAIKYVERMKKVQEEEEVALKRA